MMKYEKFDKPMKLVFRIVFIALSIVLITNVISGKHGKFLGWEYNMPDTMFKERVVYLQDTNPRIKSENKNTGSGTQYNNNIGTVGTFKSK